MGGPPDGRSGSSARPWPAPPCRRRDVRNRGRSRPNSLTAAYTSLGQRACRTSHSVAHPVEGSGAEVLHQHVGPVEELLELLAVVRDPQVERRGRLAPVERLEVHAATPVEGPEPPRVVPPTGTLHLDHPAPRGRRAPWWRTDRPAPGSGRRSLCRRGGRPSPVTVAGGRARVAEWRGSAATFHRAVPGARHRRGRRPGSLRPRRSAPRRPPTPCHLLDMAVVGGRPGGVRGSVGTPAARHQAPVDLPIPDTHIYM